MNMALLRSIDRVVAATDLSPASELAVEQAALLAKRWGAALFLLHVFNDGFWATLKALYQAEQWVGTEPVLAARQRLSQQVRELGERHGLKVSGETRTGRAATEIAAFCREEDAQLLVVGEHGEDWIGDTLVGGTALKVLKRAERPVLLVRRPVSPEVSHILVATDFSETSMRAAELAGMLFPESHRELVHAYSVAFEGRMRLAGASSEDIERYRKDELARAEQQILQQVRTLRARSPARPLLLHGYPAAALIQEAERARADLIVIGKHGGTVLDERLLGSVTHNVLYGARCNVLLVP